MASIYVDVDLYDFDTDDLLRELKRRVDESDRMNEAKQLKFKEEIRKAMKGAKLDMDSLTPLRVETIDDTLKYEHLQRIWDRYNWSQVTDALPA